MYSNHSMMKLLEILPKFCYHL